MSTMSVMTHNPKLIDDCLEGVDVSHLAIERKAGDTKIVWDKDNRDDVAAAKAAFEKLVKKGRHLAYKVTGKGQPGEQIREFDPNIEAIIMVPQMAGG
jgi:hypothetical protein